MKGTFHLSVDDANHTLVDSSYNDLRDLLKELWKTYNVQTGMYLFYTDLDVTLKEVDRIEDQWLFFGPHSLDDITPPWQQNRLNQINTFNKIYQEIDRFSGNRCSSLRLHMYSECYENAKYFLDNNVNELFTTHRPAGLYRLGDEAIKTIKERGTVFKNDLMFTTTNFRVEELANDSISKEDFLREAKEVLKKQNRIIIHSHEYEHDRPEVNEMFFNCVKWMVEDLDLRPEQQ